MLVREMMSRNVVSVRPEDSLVVARDRLRAHQIHHLLVMTNGEVTGVLSMRDLAGKADALSVAEVMSSEVASVDVDSSLRKAASLMIRSTTGCLPVTEGGKVVGIITTTDLMRVLNADMTLS